MKAFSNSQCVVVAAFVLLTTGCRHASEEVIAPTVPPSMENDYRDRFCDDLRFTVLTRTWMLGQPTIERTTEYDGVVRLYEPEDSFADLFSGDDSGEDPGRKVTIRFLADTKITSLIEEDGALVDRSGYHYGHSGGFTHEDTLRFTVGGLGGLGYGLSYNVVGVRH